MKSEDVSLFDHRRCKLGHELASISQELKFYDFSCITISFREMQVSSNSES